MTSFIKPQEATKFRNHQGQMLTGKLFWDIGFDPNTALYVLKRNDFNGYPSLYKLYMEMEDTVEFDFANTFFESYEHWEQICKTAFMVDLIAQWRKELELKLRARALRAIRETAKDGYGNKSFEANKFLLIGGWVSQPNGSPKRGRPSKDEIKNVAKEMALDSASLKEDLVRLGIN